MVDVLGAFPPVLLVASFIYLKAECRRDIAAGVSSASLIRKESIQGDAIIFWGQS